MVALLLVYQLLLPTILNMAILISFLTYLLPHLNGRTTNHYSDTIRFNEMSHKSNMSAANVELF